MKKLIYIYLSLVALNVALIYYYSHEQSQPSINHDTIVIGLDDTFAPMGFRNEAGDIIGFDIDLAKETFQRLGKKVIFKPISWENKEAELNHHKIDVLWNGLTITPERQQAMAITDAYIQNSLVVLTTHDTINNLDQLTLSSVAVQAGSSSETALNKVNFPTQRIKKYNDYLTALIDLESGRVDAVLIDKIVAQYIEKQQNKQFIMSENLFDSEQMGVAVQKDNVHLRDQINRTLNEIRQDGTFNKIHDKWFAN